MQVKFQTATVVRAPVPMHGKTSQVSHDGTRLFGGLASEIEVGRYHSLVIPPDDLPSGFARGETSGREGLDRCSRGSCRRRHVRGGA